MRYNRDESFRYGFSKPIACTFKIVEKDGKPIESKSGKADLLDISPHGLKISTSLDLPVDEYLLHAEVTFKIIEETLSMRGQFLWKQKNALEYHYGIKGLDDLELKDSIVKELKNYANATS